MITEDDWRSWKEHKVTKKLNSLIKVGSNTALLELVEARGEVADYQRGAIRAYDDIAALINTGEDLKEEEKDA
jgi:hypothetical protein